MPVKGQLLCRKSDLEKTGAKEIVLEEHGARVSVFVVAHQDSVFAYVNSCPHARLPLNWREDVFFDLTRSHLLCANHGAYFEISTGKCVRGPCKGQALKSLPVRLGDDGMICAD